uniref:Uncharacterized protein n=1 Tax=Megaselia scalaris TaxID=36166 RepID=T1GEP3_MEGSC
MALLKTVVCLAILGVVSAGVIPAGPVVYAAGHDHVDYHV